MSWLFRNNWPWSLLAFLVGAIITWFLLSRRAVAPVAAPQPAEQKEEVLVGVSARQTQPEPPPVVREEPKPAPVVPAAHFSQRMDAGESAEPTLFDDAVDEVPPGRYGEGSAEAVPHQGPPDGFTIKGNAQSMLFHTPESPYYGRTKPEVWFRTEADAERAGFTKYVRKPRRSPGTPEGPGK
jgi:hypothetical protein